MVNLGKEIENDKKWNEKKLGPCMKVFLNFDPCTTLDLFHPKWLQWLQKRSNIKEIETWKVANRLCNGKMIKKMTNIESGLSSSGYEQSECRSSHMVISTKEIPIILHLLWAKTEGKQQEKRINTREKQSFT